AVTGHPLQPVGAEIGNQKVAVAREREAVGQRALQVAGGVPVGTIEVIGNVLRHQGLRAVRVEPDDAAAGIGCPERAVALGEDAFGALQVRPDVLQGASVDTEVEDRVGGGRACSHRLTPAVIRAWSLPWIGNIEYTISIIDSPRVLAAPCAAGGRRAAPAPAGPVSGSDHEAATLRVDSAARC